MRFLLSLLSLALTLSSSAMADVPAEKRAERDGIASPGGSEGAAGICTIIYYNYCSGWIWLWSPFRAGGERDYYWQIGVVFDLPEDCGKEPDEECTNLQFWWYWRYTIPGYYFTLDYHLWELDDQWCKTGAAIGSILGDDPIERWNSYPGMGSTNADYVAITASSFYCCPYWVTDAPARNANAPVACKGWPGPGPAHSFYFGGSGSEYCPPLSLSDSYGPAHFLMHASFSCGTTGVENASWSSIQSLFR